MGRYLKTRCFVDGKPADLRVRKMDDGLAERISRVSRSTPIRATHFALKVRDEWRIYTTHKYKTEGFSHTVADPQLVHTLPTVEAAEMWLMYRGSNDG